MSDSIKLNPQIKTISIGVSALQEIKIFPLSISDQMKLTELMKDVVLRFLEGKKERKDKDNIAIIDELAAIIQENVVKILAFVCPEQPENILDLLTNSQLAEIATIIYEDNYGGPIKNVLSLFKKEKAVLTA